MNLVGEALKKLWTTTGICEGKEFLKWIDEKIEKQIGIKHCTFKELKERINRGKKGKNGQPLRDLYVYATCIKSEHAIICINSEEKQWENIIISDAIRASMSIPGVFKPHFLHWKNENGERHSRNDLGSFVDGGVLYNFPLETFDKKKYQATIPLGQDAGEYHQLNKKTLGFCLYTPDENTLPPNLKIETVGDLLTSFISLYYSSENQIRHLTPYNKHRVIPISNEGVGTLDFSLSDEQKQGLVFAGKKGTENFFNQNSHLRGSTNSLFLIPQFKDKQKSHSNVKANHPDFIPRKNLLEKMGVALCNPVNQTLSKGVIWGSGGLGKSETAIAFANQNRDQFFLIHWIDASTEEIYSQGYKELAKILGVPFDEKESLESIRDRVHYKLQHRKNQKPFLLIFDNVEQSYPFPAQGHGALLITSQQKSLFEKFSLFEIQPFTEEESQELLCLILKCTPTENTKALAKQLDFYPLALNQAAHYISETPGMTIERYLQRLQEDLPLTLIHMPQDGRYSKNLFTSWKIIEEGLKKAHPQSLSFLQLCAYFHPDTIPLLFLNTWIKQQHPSKKELEQEFLSETILHVLTDHGLIRFNKENNFLSLHRVRQAIILSSLDKESCAPKVAFSLLASIANELDEDPSPKEWEIFKIWAPHAQLALDENPQKNKEEIFIRNKLGRWDWIQGKYLQSIELLTEALSITILNINNTAEEATALNHLGNVSYSLGNYEEAKKLHTKAHSILQNLFGNKHPKVATSLNNLGDVSWSLGNFEEAKKRYTQALSILQNLFGDNHPNTIIVKNNLLDAEKASKNICIFI